MFTYLRCIGDMDIFDVERSVGVCCDASKTSFLDDFDDLSVGAHITDSFAVEISDFFH